MEGIDEFYKKSYYAENESIEMKQLVKTWCRQLNTLPYSKLKQLKLWNIKATHEPINNSKCHIKNIVFRVNYKTEYGFACVMVGSSEIFGNWIHAKS